MVDPASEPFPAEFDIYHSLEHILLRFSEFRLVPCFPDLTAVLFISVRHAAIVRRCSSPLDSDHGRKKHWADRLLVEAVECKK